MKRYDEFLNESNFKFDNKDYVKIKKTGKIGQVIVMEVYSDGLHRYGIYTVKFSDDTNFICKASVIEKATKEEIDFYKEELQFYLDTSKYNI
jgi:hypothetical protein